MTESAELKPCPFCGGPARRSEGGVGENKYFGTGCASSAPCPAYLHGLFHRTQAQADDAWNRRSPADAPDGWRTLLKDLADELENEIMARYQGYPPNDRRFVRDMLTVKEARAMLAGTPAPPDQATCGCQTCRPITMEDMRMVLCPTCGNKRCPHANDHRNACTGSNEPGQPGSAYPKAAASPNTTASQAEGGAA